jgi:hypothetical protein
MLQNITTFHNNAHLIEVLLSLLIFPISVNFCPENLYFFLNDFILINLEHACDTDYSFHAVYVSFHVYIRYVTLTCFLDTFLESNSKM